MSNFAERSDCKSARLPNTEDVTKNVLRVEVMFPRSPLRFGIAMSGAKAPSLFNNCFGTSEDVPRYESYGAFTPVSVTSEHSTEKVSLETVNPSTSRAMS